jgi:nucleoid DNA-binding protein
MGIEDIVIAVHNQTGVPRSTVKRLLREFVAVIRANISNEPIKLRGLGTLYVRECSYTLPTLESGTTKRVHFRPSPLLKESANVSV